jgi:hypothetical protein
MDRKEEMRARLGIPQIKINRNFLPVSSTNGGCAAVGQWAVACPIVCDRDQVPARRAVAWKGDCRLGLWKRTARWGVR